MDNGNSYSHSDFMSDRRKIKEVFDKFLENRSIRLYENDLYIMRLTDEICLYFELDSIENDEIVLTCVEFEAEY